MPVNAVIDVGVMYKTRELISAFPKIIHILVEPITEYNEKINESYKDMNYCLINAAACNYDGTVTLKTSNVIPGMTISHARIVDKPGPESERYRKVPARRLDTLVPELEVNGPYLLKIDVDGAEITVLEGAEKLMSSVSVVMIEVHPWDLVERSVLLTNYGFEPFDLVDLCYYDRRWVQSDMVFVNKQTLQDCGIELYRGGFDFSRWHHYNPS